MGKARKVWGTRNGAAKNLWSAESRRIWEAKARDVKGQVLPFRTPVPSAARAFFAWFRGYRPPNPRAGLFAGETTHVHLDRIEIRWEPSERWVDFEELSRLLGEALRRERFWRGV